MLMRKTSEAGSKIETTINEKNRSQEAPARPICAEIIRPAATIDAGYLRELLEPATILKKSRGKKKRNREYLDLTCAFDIETSTVQTGEHYETVHRQRVTVPEYNSFMYIWQFQIGTACTVIGRTWNDYRNFIALIDSVLQDLHGEAAPTLVVYVHNLSYEFQFLAGVFDFTPNDVFAIRARKVLTVNHGPLEYRCSYLHSNKTLDKFCKTFDVEHSKMVGDLDYSITRYPWTELTPEEMQYCVNDVRGLVEAIITEMQRDGDTLATIPRTSTGYVRRDAKAVIFKYGIRKIKPLQPDYNTYVALREAFRGGDTHANRYYAGVILHDVKSKDMSSAYPGTQCTCAFPMTPFRPETASADRLRELLRFKKAVLMRVAFFNIRLAVREWGFPYISISKCRNISHFLNDNGRLLEAEYLETTITDVDFEIIRNEYDWDGLTVIDLWSSTYGQLPLPLRKLVISYFEKKTTLKGVNGEEYEYIKSKNKLNSIYGMTAQNPLHIETKFINGNWDVERVNLEALYNKQIAHAFLPYQWGVWTTCHTRRRLKIAQRAAGVNGVYCDTDSIKYVNSCDLDYYNADVHYMSNEYGAYATDPAGRTHYMGVYEDEEPYKNFVTWGAKKYAYTYADGAAHTTIAGVNKKAGGPELDAAGGLPALRPGFTFHDAAGKLLVYNDTPNVDHIEAEGHILPITRNVSILKNTYTVGITHEYARLLALDIVEVDI